LKLPSDISSYIAAKFECKRRYLCNAYCPPTIALVITLQVGKMWALPRTFPLHFYSVRNARIASAVLATAIPSVCLSVRPSVRLSVCHTPVLCQND